jgi:DNA-binding HxlR family transcriptional regulator/putative sterol carrier protein
MAAARTPRSRKTYDQYCAVARALDVVGERWTLLIVRDLLMGPKRYTDLRDGLPGIASDILTARLRTLEEAGFVRRRDLPRPAPATVYELTESANRLKPVILALGQVAVTTLGAPEPGEDVRAERLVVGLRVSFRRGEFADLCETYELVIDGEPFTVEVSDGAVATRPGGAPSPSIRLATDAGTFVDLMTGRLPATESLAAGRATLEGKRSVFERFIDAFAYPQARAAIPG